MMPVSRSTPRIRRTQALYGLLLAAVALSGGRSWEGLAGLGLQAAGFALVVTGTLWRLWSTAFIAGRKDVELVCEGPYARCRHPLYFGSLVASVGLALSTRSVVIMLVLPGALTVLLWSAIRREESLLAAGHGGRWQDYRARVPAVWPRAGRMPPAPPREVDLSVYFKAFLDAATVFGLWLLVILLDALRSMGAWPALFQLP